jgi:hypothetical protein
MRPIGVIAKSPGVLLLLLVLSLSGCASAPTQEMSNARQSVQAAHEAGATEYATQNLEVARDYLARAERELELRYFARARHDAIVAKSEAIKAHNVAVSLRRAQEAIESSAAGEAARAEARLLLQDALEAARQGKDRRAMQLAEQAGRVAAGEQATTID